MKGVLLALVVVDGVPRVGAALAPGDDVVFLLEEKTEGRRSECRLQLQKNEKVGGFLFPIFFPKLKSERVHVLCQMQGFFPGFPPWLRFVSWGTRFGWADGARCGLKGGGTWSWDCARSIAIDNPAAVLGIPGG